MLRKSFDCIYNAAAGKKENATDLSTNVDKQRKKGKSPRNLIKYLSHRCCPPWIFKKRGTSPSVSLALSLSQVTLMFSSRCFPKPFTSQFQNYNCPPLPQIAPAHPVHLINRRMEIHGKFIQRPSSCPRRRKNENTVLWIDRWIEALRGSYNLI